MEFSDVLDLILAPFEAFTDPNDRLSLIYQFSALVIAIGVYVFTRARDGKLEAAGLIRWLLPAEVLRHPSAQVDFAYFFLNRILQAGIYGSIMVTTPPVANATIAVLTWAFGFNLRSPDVEEASIRVITPPSTSMSPLTLAASRRPSASSISISPLTVSTSPSATKVASMSPLTEDAAKPALRPRAVMPPLTEPRSSSPETPDTEMEAATVSTSRLL